MPPQHQMSSTTDTRPVPEASSHGKRPAAECGSVGEKDRGDPDTAGPGSLNRAVVQHTHGMNMEQSLQETLLLWGRGRISISLSQNKTTREKQIPPDKPEVQTQPPLRKRLPEPTSEAAEAQRKTAASKALAATRSPATSQ